MLETGRILDVDENQSKAIPFNLFDAHRVQPADDFSSVLSGFPILKFLVKQVVMRNFSIEILPGSFLLLVQLEIRSKSDISCCGADDCFLFVSSWKKTDYQSAS